ncbi:MAG: aminotransferase class IV [Acidiferrobacterales bacterium]
MTSAKAQPSSAAGYPPGVAYIDGRFCPLSEAKVSILDWGLLRSDATYDVVHVWHGRFFRLDAHISRFLKSAARLRLNVPLGPDELIRTLKEGVRRSGLRDAYVEMICTRGVAPPSSRDPRDATNEFMAFAIPFGWVANEEQRARGLHLAVSGICRISPEAVDPRIKNYHWLDFVQGLFEAYDRNAENVILVDRDGNITEGPGFNVLMVKDGHVTTPAVGVLEGITRRTTLELCAEVGIRANEEPIPAATINDADEVFITSTAGGVMAVTCVDGKPIGNGKPGPITKQLTDLYWAKHKDPAWTTPVD